MKDLTRPHAYALLDATRGAAAIAVFMAHLSEVFFWRLIGPSSAAALAAGMIARHAVIIFFLLSGNLVTHSIKLNIRRNGRMLASEYVAARLARVYPPLLGAMLLCAIVWLIIHGFNLPGAASYGLPGDLFQARAAYTINIHDFIGALTFKGGMFVADGPLWTLFIEVQIYVVALAVAAWTSPGLWTRIWTFCLALFALSLLRHEPWVLAGVWGIGAATSLYKPKRPYVLIAAAAMLAALAAVAIVHPAYFGSQMDSMPGRAVQLACCIPYCAVLFFIPLNLNYPPTLIATGNFSYSLYIIHFPLLLLALSLSQNLVGYSYAGTWLTAALTAISVIAIVIPFARLFEQQEKWKRVLMARLLWLSQLKIGRD